jgi:glycosyltransferase involved in cell wall biosynthesis
MRKKKTLFVGSFKSTSKDGSVGGQMFACKTIINSSVSDFVDWTLIDTTSDSNTLISFHKRFYKAFSRISRFIYYMVFYKYDSVLIFVADGLSFWEKGLMVVIAKYISNSKVIIAPRSGFIVNDIEQAGVLKRFVKTVFRKVDFVVCQSTTWKHLFEKTAEQINNDKYIVVENIIDFSIYEVLPLRFIENNEKITILFMSWVCRNKGVFELIEAVKMLEKEKLNFKLVIAGKGQEYEEIENLINSSNLREVIELRGWVLGNDKLTMLAGSDIFILPTYFEGYPNSLIEAMASGKACVASRVGSIPDIISDMETGILIEKQNASQLYTAIKTLIQDSTLRNAIGIQARKHVRETNSAIHFVTKFREILS